MIVVRSILYNVLFYLNLGVLLLVALLTLPLPRRAVLKMAELWGRTSVWMLRVVCGTRMEIRGLEHLAGPRLQGPFVIAAKHQSTWETFALPTLMSHPLAFVFKRELLHVPFFGWAIGRLDMIHIDRSKRTEAWGKVAERGKALLARGHWVIMFPEGTRIPRGSQGVY